MPAVNLLLQRVTHPQRKPYVRSTTFIDGEGPPPYGYFDETQDHLGAYFHSLLGWKYSVDSDDCTGLGTNTGYLGRRMRVTRQTNCELSPGSAVSFLGSAFELEAASAPVTLDGDFLLTARVVLIDVANLDTAALGGFALASSNPSLVPVGPGFAAGSDSPNWRILYAPDNTSAAVLADTGIPIDAGLPFMGGGSAYTLQVSRVAGAVRWHINGQLCRLNGAEGLYYPYRILGGCKFIHVGRNHPGDPGAGFDIYFANLIAERTTL